MTAQSPLSPGLSIEWQAIGAWQAGTVVDVALTRFGGVKRGLLASRAGAYGWTQPGSGVVALPQGLSDLNMVAVSFAGGDATTPAVALAATVTGRLFRSAYDPNTLSCGHWQEVSSWAGLGVAVVLTPSPAFADDQTLFIGTPTGIFRTQDDGQSWESCNFGLLDEDVLCLVCAPNFAENEALWAGTAGGGLYRSRNSARAWRESGNGLPDAAVQSLVVSPNYAEDRTIFAGMEAHGVYCSRDGGENWASLALAGQSANTLACPQAGLLWAGTENGLWRVTTESGDAIQVTGAGETVLSVAADVEGQVAIGLFGGALWLTEDGSGAPPEIIWQKPQVALHAPPIVTRVGDEIFMLDSDGLIARSQAGGAQWVEMESASLDSIFALDGARVPSEGVAEVITLFAATATGLSRWQSDTNAWQELASEAFQNHTALGIELPPNFAKDPSLLVVAHDGELLLSQDSGASWQAITGPWRGQTLLHAHFATDDAREVVALTVKPNESGHFDGTVWHTVDLGRHWETLAGMTCGVPAMMVAWPHDAAERALFLATQHRVIKLYHQSDPLTLHVHQHFFDEALRVTALAATPDYVESHTIWAATTGGLYRSVDRGLSWGLLLVLPLELPIVWLDVTNTHVNAITLGGRVWRAAL